MLKVIKRRKTPEQDFQRQLVKALAYALPKDCFFTHFPMGGGGELRGAILKGLGAKSGVPDLLFVYQGKANWLELKSKAGTLSIEQRATQSDLIAAGSRVETVRSIPEALDRLRDFGIPLRTTHQGRE